MSKSMPLRLYCLCRCVQFSSKIFISNTTKSWPYELNDSCFGPEQRPAGLSYEQQSSIKFAHCLWGGRGRRRAIESAPRTPETALSP